MKTSPDEVFHWILLALFTVCGAALAAMFIAGAVALWLEVLTVRPWHL